MDLQTISSQMKVVIQKHQIVVTEMRNDPQNPVLHKRLHDLQLEILSLNERQKQVVEDLRKNLEVKQCDQSISNHTGYPTSPSPHVSSQEVRMAIAPNPISNCISSVCQPVSLAANNVTSSPTTFTFKTPVGTVVLPNCTGTTIAPKSTVEHPKVHPVLVVPTPSGRVGDGQPQGVLLNLVPPIRVPQYPPPTQSLRSPLSVVCQKNIVSNNFVPIAPISTVPMSNALAELKAELSSSSSNGNSPVHVAEKQLSLSPKKIIYDQKKTDFLHSLGLVSKDCLTDLKSKKQERKRRSTANPQFSNAALEEKWRNAAATQALGMPHKRPRGRPRLEPKTATGPTNGTYALADLKPNSPIDNNCNISSSSSPVNNTSVVPNGIYKPVCGSDDGKNVEQMLSGLCIVCTQPGDLVKCDTCAKQQHPGCMQPPLVARPPAPWQCSDCQSRTVSLTVVQSYDVLKAAKEDEKRKLLKKSLELRLKRSQLEGRLHQLRELSGKQKNRQSELQASSKDIELLLEHVQSVVSSIRLCS